MRFRAKLASEQLSLLTTVLQPLARLSTATTVPADLAAATANSFIIRNSCILYLDNDHLRLSLKGRSNDTDGMACLAELLTQHIFCEHRIESAAALNKIVLEVDIIQLRTALQTLQESGDGKSHKDWNNNSSSSQVNDSRTSAFYSSLPPVVLKLAKRHGWPCLCLEAQRHGVQVHQACWVRVCQPDEMKQHLPPAGVATPTLQLEILPQLPHLKTLLDRLKHLTTTVYLEGSPQGELWVSSDHDGAALRTYVPHVHVVAASNARHGRGGGGCRVKVSTKKLATTLQWPPFVCSSILLCLEASLLVLHVSLQPSSVGFLTYYVPVHYLAANGDDDDDND